MRTKSPVIYIAGIIACIAVILMASIVGNRKDGDAEPGNAETPEMTPSVESGTTEAGGEQIVYSFEYASESNFGEASEGNPVFDISNDIYSNAGTIGCATKTGGYVSAGIVSDADGRLILNPVYSPADDELIPWLDRTQFAFYITCSRGAVEYSYKVAGTYDGSENYTHDSLYITDRCYDSCVPADYVSDDDYGIAWTDTEYAQGASLSDEVLFSMRIIRIGDGTLMDIVHFTVKPDGTGTYALSEMHRGDVLVENELSEADRARMLQLAKEFLSDPERGQSLSLPVDDWDSALGEAIVEKVETPYFPRLLDAEGLTANAGKYVGCDIYAVNLPYAGLGFVTIYISTEMQLMGFTEPIAPGDDAPVYEVFGYDPFNPQTEETLTVPEFTKEAFFSE